MIRLYESNETIFTHNKTVLPHVMSCVVSEEEAGMFSATLEMPIDSRVEENMVFVAKTPRGEQAFRIKKITRKLTKGKRILEVYGRHIFYDLLDDIILNIRPTDATANTAIQAILSGSETAHGFSGSSNVPGAHTANYVRMNPIQAIMGQNENSILSRWGGFLYRDNYQIEVRASSLDRGYEVRFGKNLIGIDQDIDLSDLATRIYPTVVLENEIVTALPEKYVDSPRIGSYPAPIIRELRVDLSDEQKELPLADIYDVMRNASLLLFGDVDLPKVNYKIDFVELSKTEQLKHLAILETLDISDTVSVKVEPFGVDIKSRLIKYSYDGIRGRFLSMELGNFRPKLTNARVDLVRTVEKLNQNLLDGEVASRLKDALDRIVGHKGGYKIELFDEFGNPTGTAYMDSPDVNTAQHYILINSEGIAFGDSGLANPPELAITIDGQIVGDGAFFNSLVTNLIQSDLGQSLNLASNVSITSRVTHTDMASYVTDATYPLASKTYVDSAIDAINRANPNLVSNRSDKWAQGNLVSGAQVASTKHIHTQSFYPIRAGSATIKVSPLYEAAIAIFDSNYTHLSTTPFSVEQTVSIPANSYFRAILRRVGGTEDIIPSAIDTAELKVENAAEATQWTPYFGDMTLEEQKEFFTLQLTSTNGWTVDTSLFTTQLRATLYLFNEDVSTTFPGANIFWYRRYPGEEKALIGSGLTYDVSAAETSKSATYEVEFFIPANKHYLMTKSGDRLLTKSGDFLLAKVSNDPGISTATSKVLVRDYRDKILSAEASIAMLSNDITFKVEQTAYNADKNAIESNITTLSTQIGGVVASIDGATHRLTSTSYSFYDADGNLIMDNALGMANEQNLMKSDDCESGFPLIIPIHFGESTSSIAQAKVKWRNSPFRATAKSASAGGGTKTSAAGGATTSGASSSSTTASGGSTTATADGISDQTFVPRTTTYAGEVPTSSAGAGTASHIHVGGLHAHSVSIYAPPHKHTVSIGAHSHGMAHTHSIGSHTHDIDLTHTHNLIFGIVEEAVTDNSLTFWVDGVQRGSANAAQSEIDLTAFLQTNGWHIVELRTPSRKRIDANIFVKSYIKR